MILQDHRSYSKDILKFTESAIGKSSGNIAYKRKLLTIQLKLLKNTCYGVKFCNVARKKPATLLKYESFTDVLQKLNPDKKNIFSRQVSKRWIQSFLFLGPLQ